MSRKIGIAQIGLGYWGPNLLRNMRSLADVEVVGVADVRSECLQGIEHGARLAKTGDYQDLLKRPDVDAVVVATPASLHGRHVEDALQAGKHVLVEKPLAANSKQARKLVELADRTGLVLMVGHTFLYNDAVRWLKRYMDEGQLGDVLYMYGQRLNLGRVRQDVNALWNSAPHDISIMDYLVGATPVEVSARGFAYLQEGIEDVVFMTLVFPRNVSAHLHMSWLDPNKVRRLTVVGTQKMAVYNDVSTDARITLYDRGVDRVPTADSPRDFDGFAEFQLRLRSGDVTIPSLRFREPLNRECEHFVDCVRRGQRPLTDGRNGLEVVRILEAAQRSIDEHGRNVRVEQG